MGEAGGGQRGHSAGPWAATAGLLEGPRAAALARRAGRGWRVCSPGEGLLPLPGAFSRRQRRGRPPPAAIPGRPMSECHGTAAPRLDAEPICLVVSAPGPWPRSPPLLLLPCPGDGGSQRLRAGVGSLGPGAGLGSLGPGAGLGSLGLLSLPLLPAVRPAGSSGAVGLPRALPPQPSLLPLLRVFPGLTVLVIVHCPLRKLCLPADPQVTWVWDPSLASSAESQAPTRAMRP